MENTQPSNIRTEKPGESKTSAQSVSCFNQKSKTSGKELGPRTKSEEDKLRETDRREAQPLSKAVSITDVGVYEGSYSKNNIPHGHGKLKLKNGDFYEGHFQNGCFDGEGRMVSSDGCEYLGTWKDNCREGKGKETWPNGNTFTGEFQADKKHGYGMNL